MVRVPYLIIGGVHVPVPIGFRFDPTDEEVVLQFLSRKVLSLPMLPFPEMVMPEIHISQFDPWNLPGGDEEEKFFFTREQPEMAPRCVKMIRASVAGVWREKGEEAILSPDATDIIAMKRTYNFRRTGGQWVANHPHASWTMHEYRLIRTAALNLHLHIIAHANGVPLEFTRTYACKIVRKMRSGR